MWANSGVFRGLLLELICPLIPVVTSSHPPGSSRPSCWVAGPGHWFPSPPHLQRGLQCAAAFPNGIVVPGTVYLTPVPQLEDASEGNSLHPR